MSKTKWQLESSISVILLNVSNCNPVIYVSVSEKGKVDVELTSTGQQGHSSQPPRESAIGVMAGAVARLEEERQPSRFGRIYSQLVFNVRCEASLFELCRRL